MIFQHGSPAAVANSIVANTPDLVYAFDLQHRFTYANPALLAMWGKTWDEAIGRNCLELGYERWHAEMHDREIEQVIETKTEVRGEVPFVGTNGRRIYDYIFVPVLDAAGAVVGIAGTTRDVTERKRKELALRFLVDLNAASQRIAGHDEIMAVTARLLGEHLGVDRCAYAEVENEDLFVITGDFVRGVPSIVGRWPVAAFGEGCVRAMRSNRSFVVKDTDADPRIGPTDLAAYRATNIRAVICVPLHKEGKFTAAMAVHQAAPREWAQEEIELVELVVARCWESLERARALRRQEASERRLRLMAEAMPQKIFTATAAGAVDYVNPQWLQYTGAELETLLGWGWAEWVHPEDRDANLRQWRAAVAVREHVEFEHRFRNAAGEYRWHLTRAHPMLDAGGEVLFWIGSTTDIELQKRAKDELERVVSERTEQLRRTIGELEAFSYSVAHDLRAPLRRLQGFADMLTADHGAQLDADGKDLLRRIGIAAEKMDRLVRDILEYSRVSRGDAGRMQVVELKPLLLSILETYPQLSFEAAEVRLPAEIPPVWGTEALCTQIFANLLGNAVKFVPAGTRPVVDVRVEADEREVRIAVSDNGIGISPKYHAKIFEVFQQAEVTFGGTGIGLSIVHKAIERLGGRIEVQSEVGQGSTFVVMLKRASQPPQP